MSTTEDAIGGDGSYDDGEPRHANQNSPASPVVSELEPKQRLKQEYRRDEAHKQDGFGVWVHVLYSFQVAPVGCSLRSLRLLARTGHIVTYPATLDYLRYGDIP